MTSEKFKKNHYQHLLNSRRLLDFCGCCLRLYTNSISYALFVKLCTQFAQEGRRLELNGLFRRSVQHTFLLRDLLDLFFICSYLSILLIRLFSVHRKFAQNRNEKRSLSELFCLSDLVSVVNSSFDTTDGNSDKSANVTLEDPEWHVHLFYQQPCPLYRLLAVLLLTLCSTRRLLSAQSGQSLR